MLLTVIMYIIATMERVEETLRHDHVRAPAFAFPRSLP